jgi:4-diphosphocytidyl-2-C-methyl-D-erythritol kinase
MSTAVSDLCADRLVLPAFAKVNLVLRVLGRRPDGFHELRTVFQTVSLHDQLTFEPVMGDGIELFCTAPDVPAGETNLVYRAAVALKDRLGLKRGAKIIIDKRIPAGGGLGGGSSDAAVALLGLARLWKIRTRREELAEIGARLGADVPFFFTGGTALGTGTGTSITPLDDLGAMQLLIVTPSARVSTAAAYAALKAPALTKTEDDNKLPVSRADEDLRDSFSDILHNDFEAVVFRMEPEIERARSALVRAGARGVRLSGSGSSVFGLLADAQAAARAQAALQTAAAWHVFACSTLARQQYREALGACAEWL